MISAFKKFIIIMGNSSVKKRKRDYKQEAAIFKKFFVGLERNDKFKVCQNVRNIKERKKTDLKLVCQFRNLLINKVRSEQANQTLVVNTLVQDFRQQSHSYSLAVQVNFYLNFVDDHNNQLVTIDTPSPIKTGKKDFHEMDLDDLLMADLSTFKERYQPFVDNSREIRHEMIYMGNEISSVLEDDDFEMDLIKNKHLSNVVTKRKVKKQKAATIKQNFEPVTFNDYRIKRQASVAKNVSRRSASPNILKNLVIDLRDVKKDLKIVEEKKENVLKKSMSGEKLRAIKKEMVYVGNKNFLF